MLQQVRAEDIMLVDLDRVALPMLNALGQAYGKTERKDHIYYVSSRKRKLWLGFGIQSCGGAIGVSRILLC